MTANTTTVRGDATTERVIATATSLAPVAAGVVAPFLGTDAATVVDLAALASAALAAANVTEALPERVYDVLPAGDILRAHRLPNFIAHLTTGVALGMGTLAGAGGSDALLGGITQLATAPVPGIVSLGWWAAALLVPYQLRRVLGLGRRRASPHTTPKIPAPPANPPQPAPGTPREVIHQWGQYISTPNTGSHPLQILTLTHFTPKRQWTGTIDAPTGKPCTVTAEAVSTVYRVPTAWITIGEGAHSGQRTITVNLTAPPELDTRTLEGAWRKWVTKPGGLMAGTHLENVTDDPNTGGQVALVVAGEDIDRLKHPDRLDLAGALRVKNPLLISYEPCQNPREAFIRKMEHNPLQKGATFPGLHVLTPNDNGYIQLGPGVSGFPARIQLWDPALGAQHCIVAGVTGSGKGGTLQLIALAHHVNGSAILYADPKGSSNPAIETMAAYSGLGPDAAMGALRLYYLILQHRIEQSKQLGMKNFRPSKTMPWVPLILDEASKLLGENAEHKKEATFIVNAGATLGRSLGMPVILANQLMQLKEFGGDAAIRDNVFYGGSLILLRSDSTQKRLLDLPENFAGCNPADIPPAWSGDRDMVFDPTKPLNDPERTFGLAFAASAGAHAEMMRNWILEDATPYIDTNNIAHPTDWPDWDDRDTLAQQSVLPADTQDDEDGNDSGLLLPGFTPIKKPETADDKVLKVLRDAADPAGLEVTYLHKDDISTLSGLKGSTLNNALTDLTKTDRIHRGPNRGTYGLGPEPTGE
jgi:hypothetical protein